MDVVPHKYRMIAMTHKGVRNLTEAERLYGSGEAIIASIFDLNASSTKASS